MLKENAQTVNTGMILQEYVATATVTKGQILQIVILSANGMSIKKVMRFYEN